MGFGLLALSDLRRRTVRARVNPLDKCTIVSIYPKDINDVKPTTVPSRYHVPAGSIENPSLTVVGPASWWREIDPEQPLIEIVNNSIEVAEAVVRDYCNGLLECNMYDIMPGIFWVEGSLTKIDLNKPELQARLKTAAANQKRWYEALVKLGDVLWSRTNQNPIAIGDDMRLAAQTLGLQDKPWIKDFSTINMVKCVACGNLRNPEYPVCPICKAINDPEKAKKLNIQFAT